MSTLLIILIGLTALMILSFVLVWSLCASSKHADDNAGQAEGEYHVILPPLSEAEAQERREYWQRLTDYRNDAP